MQTTIGEVKNANEQQNGWTPTKPPLPAWGVPLAQDTLPNANSSTPLGALPPTVPPAGNKMLSFGSKRPDLLPGDYRFTSTKSMVERNCTTEYGIRDRVVVTFEIESSPVATEEHSEKFLASNYEKSRFVQFVSQLTGQPVTDNFNCELLDSWSGMLRIDHNTTTSGKTYANVVAVWDCQKAGTLVPQA